MNPMKSYRKYLFWVFWVIMAGVTALLWFKYDTNSDFIGLVESRVHVLSVQESGRVARVTAAQGDSVAAGQVLVELDMSDLDAGRAVLEAELARLERHLDADRARAGLEYEKLRTQSAADSLNMDLKKADLAEKMAELQAVQGEIDRLQAAEREGLGRSADLSDLIIRRDTLTRVISAQRAAIGRRTDTGAVKGGQERDSVVQSMMGDSLARIGEIKVELALIESRRAMRTILSPADGRVVALLVRPGDTVARYLPLVSVEQYGADFVDVYVPETSGQHPMVGGRVNLHPHRGNAPSTTGVITSVDPGYSMIPERLAFRGQFYWARKFRVRMDPGHRLMPGEAVRVELIDGTIGVSEAIASALDSGAVGQVAAEKAVNVAARPVPALIRFQGDGSFEPSGAIWLDDLGRYLIVSDDTGAKGNRHAPWLFLMDSSGVVEPEPVVLEGIDQVNDLEAITAAPDGTIYLVSSNNINKKGVRKPARQQILKVSREGRTLTVKGSAPLADAVVDAFAGKAMNTLGLSDRADAPFELNIEGAAFVDGALLLGLKQPAAADGAILWRLDDPDSFIVDKRLKARQLTLHATVDLGAAGAGRGTFSDLFMAADGTLFASSTIAGVPDQAQMGRILRLDRTADGDFEARVLAEYPGMKPEAVCQAADGVLTILFDNGSNPGGFVNLELGAR